MPRYVDHDARRRHIAATAAELVGTRGLEALTFRNVADAAGSSTTVLTHYFTDKRDLMRSTYEAVAERFGARFDDAVRRGGGLRECLDAMLPLDPDRLTEWRLLTSFWGMAASDPVLGSAQARHGRSTQRRIESLLRQHHPELPSDQVELVARRLVGFVLGLGAASALDPGHWPAAEQRRVLADELGAVRGRGPAGGRPDGSGAPGAGSGGHPNGSGRYPDGSGRHPNGSGGESGGGNRAASDGSSRLPGGDAGRDAGANGGRAAARPRPAADAAARRLRRDILAAVKQGPSPVVRRRRRRFPA
jgi:AcrR family transcriptional regulator